MLYYIILYTMIVYNMIVYTIILHYIIACYIYTSMNYYIKGPSSTTGPTPTPGWRAWPTG